MKAAVLGASGYAGTELLRLIAGHPELDAVVVAGSGSAGRRLAEHTPSLAAAYPDLVLEAVDGQDPSALQGLDVVFSALPHGRSQHLLPELVDRVGGIVDLAADFRLAEPEAYRRWYGEEHACPGLAGRFVYGLPELHRSELAGAHLIAAPGCYPTAAALALAPLARAGLLDADAPVIVDAASGTSGAGRATADHLHFSHVNGNFTAYGLIGHRHTSEMEQEIDRPVLFTPHLAPMTRGILATCYARPSGDGSSEGVLRDALEEHYADHPFVVVTGEPPSTKSTLGSNTAHVSVRADPRTGWVVALCALDNLVKGAAGQALQAWNLAAGLPETTGLPLAGTYP